MKSSALNRGGRKTSAAELKRTANDVTSPKHKTSNISRNAQYFWEKSYTHIKWNVLNILTYNLNIFDNFLQGGIVPWRIDWLSLNKSVLFKVFQRLSKFSLFCTCHLNGTHCHHINITFLFRKNWEEWKGASYVPDWTCLRKFRR